jgi:hypothetical protein
MERQRCLTVEEADEAALAHLRDVAERLSQRLEEAQIVEILDADLEEEEQA